MSGKRSFHLAVALGVGLALSMSFFSVSQASAKSVTIKAISAWPTNDGTVKVDYLGFIDQANKALQEKFPDQLEIKYIGGPEAIPVRDQAEALRMGTVDVYFGTAAYYEGIAPAANISKLSQLTPWEERENGAYDIFDQIHREKLNAVYLGRLGSQDKFQLWSNAKITTLADLKGKKIRVSPMYIDFIKVLGAIPIETKPGDIYQALERGVVDGFCWPFTKVRDWGFHEVTKYVVGPSFYMVAHPILINQDTWKRIPKAQQDLLMDVMKQEEREAVARLEKKSQAERDALTKAGLEFIAFSPEETKAYLDLAYSSGWEGLLKKSPDYGPKLQKLLMK